jgi:hypothetical protein
MLLSFGEISAVKGLSIGKNTNFYNYFRSCDKKRNGASFKE